MREDDVFLHGSTIETAPWIAEAHGAAGSDHSTHCPRASIHSMIVLRRTSLART